MMVKSSTDDENNKNDDPGPTRVATIKLVESETDTTVFVLLEYIEIMDCRDCSFVTQQDAGSVIEGHGRT